MPLDSFQIEDLRRAVLGHLAERAAVSLTADTLLSRLKREHGCTLDDVNAAIGFLVAQAFVKRVTSQMSGATRYWQVTGAGIIQHESGD